MACPFCRELFSDGEADRCPTCDLELVPMTSLPRSDAGLAEAAERGLSIAPEDQPLPWRHLGNGRGWLMLFAGLGLALFFAPWVTLIRPESATLSGFDMARGRLGWVWGGAVAWFILLPLLWTRRTLRSLQGVRAICATFSAMTALQVALLLALPPEGARIIPVIIQWRWGLFASGLTSVLATAISVRLGRARRVEPVAEPPPASPERSPPDALLH